MADQERTEQATPKKIQEARRQGKVIKSHDLVAVSSLLAAAIMLMATAPKSAQNAIGYFENALENAALVTTPETIVSQAVQLTWGILSIIAPLLSVVMVVSILANLLQSGPLFLPHKALPSLENFDPLQKLKEIFSGATIGQTFYCLAKITLIVLVFAVTVTKELPNLLNLSEGTLPEISAFFFGLTRRLLWRLCVVFLVIATTDYCIVRQRYYRKLKMTPQELREELKEEASGAAKGGKRRQALGSMLDAIGAVVQTAPVRNVAPGRQDARQSQGNKRKKS